jgi:uncharacterized protein YndB with AHSA1/START domain
VSLPEAAVGLDIAAPPQRVWQFVTDVTLMPVWSTELLTVQWAEGFDGPALGAKFAGRNRHPAVGEWTTISQIVVFDPPRRFGWAVGNPENPAATWTFDLQPTAGGTRLDYLARIGPGRSGVTMLIDREPHRAAEIVGNRLDNFRAGMRATLEGIRESAERA